MPMTDCYIDVVLGDATHRIQIKHDDKPCDAYIALDGEQISTRLKMLPYNGGVHFFECDGHRLALMIEHKEGGWEYDCFVDDQSVVNGMPFWFGKTDLVTLKRWEKSRRGGKANYWMLSCAKGALIGCAIFLVLFVGGWIAHMNITWVHLVASVVPLAALYAIFVPFEWKNNEQAYQQYLSAREAAPLQTGVVEFPEAGPDGADFSGAAEPSEPDSVPQTDSGSTPQE